MIQNLIRKHRIAKGWTQAVLAQRAGVSLSTISKAENGQDVSDLKKSQIATALEKSAEALFSPPSE